MKIPVITTTSTTTTRQLRKNTEEYSFSQDEPVLTHKQEMQEINILKKRILIL